MTKRDKKQEEIVSIVLKEANKSKWLHHSIVVGTGVGKSKIAMDIIQQLAHILSFKRILIVVDNTRLRDFNWKDDFYRWGLGELYENQVDTTTYQTAYKWTKSLDDYFIIADEMDFAFTEAYGEFFKTYQNTMMLGMTGYITDSKRNFMNKYISCLVEYSAEEAQKDGILNSTPIVFIRYDLSKEKNRLVQLKNRKPFHTSENTSYDYWDSRFRKSVGKLAIAEREGWDLKDINKVQNEIKWASIQRSNILLDLDSSANLVRRLLNHIQNTEEDAKTVIFSKRKIQSNKITSYTYHGGNTEIVNNQRFSEFNIGNIKELALVDKINRGINVNNLKYAIYESFHGSDTKLRQRLGRMMRLEPEDFATIYIMLPYFMRKSKRNGVTSYKQAGTQAVTWANNMLKGWDASQAKAWDYRSIKG